MMDAVAPPSDMPLRIGIDVGGTFTDVVVVEAGTRRIVARIKVPTTHGAENGVADGIVAGLRHALEEPGVDADRVAFIAHSTTQATNALLEGDVTPVGIVGVTCGFGWLERSQLRVPPIVLGAGAILAPTISFARVGDERAQRRAVDALLEQGAHAIVASQAFGVDAPLDERRVVGMARECGWPATGGHEVATTYGLRARTRTAVLNAAILPRMQATARVTNDAVIEVGIGAPLMIMRSDGGVMNVREVARRPVLTMLSGPAAGLAGALLHENVSDGIFIEVGGTSADCSVVRGGRPQMRAARVAGHRTMLRTIDVRTVAIGGGSVPRLRPLRDLASRDRGYTGAVVRDVGPRSAHIAGLRYSCFTPRELLADGILETLQPQAGDCSDYLALRLADGTRATVTPTCAANLLGYVPEGDFARGDEAAARLAFARVSAALGVAPGDLARAILERAAEKLRDAIGELVADYELSLPDVEIIAGGGGAAALVPFTARHVGLPYRLTRDAEVISPIGVALALVRDSVERTIPNPTPDDVVRVRREAFERVVASGADVQLVDVTVEIDPRRNLVRATASGATARASDATQSEEASAEQCIQAAARALRVPSECVAEIASAGEFRCWRGGSTGVRRILGLRAGEVPDACLVDRRGVVRLIAHRASVCSTTAKRCAAALTTILEELTAFGDVGRALPDVRIAYRKRIADLGALAEASHVLALAAEELRGLSPSEPLLILAAPRDA